MKWNSSPHTMWSMHGEITGRTLFVQECVIRFECCKLFSPVNLWLFATNKLSHGSAYYCFSFSFFLFFFLPILTGFPSATDRYLISIELAVVTKYVVTVFGIMEAAVICLLLRSSLYRLTTLKCFFQSMLSAGVVMRMRRKKNWKSFC